MKRWVSGAMAFIITLCCAQGSFALASEAAGEAGVGAAEEQVQAVEFEEAVPVLPEAEDEADAPEIPQEAGEQDLPIEGETAEDETPAETPVSETSDDVQADAEASRYGRIAAAHTWVLEEPEGAKVAALAEDSAVLVLEAAEAWFRVAFNTERGILTGCVAAESLRLMEIEETAAYLDALAASGTVAALYDGLDAPLEQLDCAFEADEAEAPETGAEAAGDDASTGTPSGEATGEPTGEATTGEPGEPTGEATEENTEENTEETAEGSAEEKAEGDGEATSETAGEADGEAADAEAGDGTAAGDETTVADSAAADGAAVAEEAAMAAAADAQSAETAGTADAASADTADATQTADATADTTTDTAYAAAAELKLSASQCVIGLKESYTGLTVTGASGSVTWTTSNKKVVRVDAATGAIKGVKKGSAVVTATDASGRSVTAKVTVKAAPKKAKFSPKKVSLGEGGKTVQLKLKLTKGSASAGIAYTSSNEGVATVDANGLVTSHGTGTAVITARTYNKKKATCKVTVYAEPAPSAIKLPAKFAIGLKETRDQLPVELVPASGATTARADITWSSTNKKVVKVDPKTGAIKGVKKGSATIVAKTANGLKAKCKVTVKKAPKKVTLNGAASTVNVGATVQYTVKLPKGSASGVTYTSSNTAVATIDSSGLATGVAAGETTITATTYNGKSAKATLTVKGSGTGSSSTDSGSKTEVEVPESMEKLGIASYQNVYSADLSNEAKLEYVIYCAQNQLGKPYVYGKGYTSSDNPTGFDCSGFVYWCFNRVGIKLEASAYKQGMDNKYTKISTINDLKRGDVVCFNTNSSDNDQSDHTGIYLGNGYFIHASSGSSKRKVCVQRFTGDSISSDYYKRAFSWGRRILN